LLNKVSQSCVA